MVENNLLVKIMDYIQSFAISASGMNLERSRVEVAALNLANANTVQSSQGVNFKPLRVIARLGSESTLSRPTFSSLVSNKIDDLSMFLPEISIEPTSTSARLVYEPGHPLANEKGFVAYAGVDAATEMVTLMSAMRSYESNVAAMNAARNMALKALSIGGAS
jgi:flagellar basal-body rod protein FlgC